MDGDPRQGPTLVGGPLPFQEPLEGGRRISLLIYHQSGTRVVSLSEGHSLVVGRDPLADVTLNDQALSRRHARFTVREGEVWVEDLESTNGTLVAGQPISRPARLEAGQEARLGGAVASLHVLASADQRQRGLDSHDQLLTLLEHELARGSLFGRPLALLMLRAANVGEQVERIRSELRPVDRLALYSDEVIEILRPETTAEAARSLAGRLREVLQAAGLTASLGLAVYPEGGTSPDALFDACREALRRTEPGRPVVLAQAEPRRWEPGTEGALPGLVVRSPIMQEIFETIDRLANSIIPVLLVGDTGTGKEVLARLIHQSGPRRGRRMASINCGAIPSTLVESVLFGHEKGAFTGATQSAKGLFEDADGGTLLLDEVGELSPSAQAALLRVLETKELSRVGSSRLIAVDVRVIAATHRDLEAMCQEERFRWDLLYRLNTMTLRVPALRERPEEIAPLAELFLRAANQANGRSVTSIEPEAMRLLHAYAWPGNVRELRNAIERAVVIARGDQLTLQDLPQALRNLTAAAPVASWASAPSPASAAPGPSLSGETPLPQSSQGLDYRAEMQQHEVSLILKALRQADWNRGRAAQILNIPVRTLSHRISQLGIKRPG